MNATEHPHSIEVFKMQARCADCNAIQRHIQTVVHNIYLCVCVFCKRTNIFQLLMIILVDGSME